MICFHNFCGPGFVDVTQRVLNDLFWVFLVRVLLV
jgi:hypothetical protein